MAKKSSTKKSKVTKQHALVTTSIRSSSSTTPKKNVNVENQCTFLPVHLRKHFKRNGPENDHDEDNYDEGKHEQENKLIEHYRRARSAYLVIADKTSTELYPKSMEQEMSTRLAQRQSLEKLLDTYSQISEQKIYRSCLQLQRQIVMEVQHGLLDSDIYIGMLEPKAQEIHYVSASNRSKMTDQRLYRNSEEQASFVAINRCQDVVIRDIAEEQNIHCFDAQTSSAPCGPFMCLPLIANQRTIGILSIDSCRKAASLLPAGLSSMQIFEILHAHNFSKACIDTMLKKNINGQLFLKLKETDLKTTLGWNVKSERRRLLKLVQSFKAMSEDIQRTKWFIDDDPLTMNFLHEIVSHSASMIEKQRHHEYIQTLANVTKDSTCSMPLLFYTAVSCLSRCLLSIDSCSIWRVEGLKSINVLSSLDAPSDRMYPFVNWSERLMKKMVLHTEDAQSNGKILQGHIQRIVVPPHLLEKQNLETKSDPKDMYLEHATYHVRWSNQSIETLTWKELRLVLTCRPLNPNHHALKTVLRELHENTEQTIFVLEDDTCLCIRFQDAHRPKRFHHVLQVYLKPEHGLDTVGYILPLLQQVKSVLEPGISCVRGRQTRGVARHQSMKRVKDRCKGLSITPSVQALEVLDSLVRGIMDEIQACLPGVAIDILELRPLGRTMVRTFAKSGKHPDVESREVLKILDVEMDGRYFECLHSGQAQVLQPDDPTNLMILVPGYQEDAKVSLLIVSDFRDVEKGRVDEDHPEHGVLVYLAFMSRMIAATIRSKRRSKALFDYSQLVLDPLLCPKHIFYQTLKLMKNTLLGCLKLTCVQYKTTSTSSLRQYRRLDTERARTPSEKTTEPSMITTSTRNSSINQMRLKMKAKKMNAALASVIEINTENTSSNEIVMFEYVHNTPEKVENDDMFQIFERLRYHRDEIQLGTIQKHFDLSASDAQRWYTILENAAVLKLEHEGMGFQYPPTEANELKDGSLKSFQSFMKAKVKKVKAMIGPTTSMSLLFAVIPSISNSQYQMVLLAEVDSGFTFSTDQMFLDMIASIASTLCHCVGGRLRRGAFRKSQLALLQQDCQKKLEHYYTTVLPCKTFKEENEVESLIHLQKMAIKSICVCFQGCNVYIGLYEAYRRYIKYTSCSAHSGMLGKRLKRGKGIWTFKCLDEQKNVVVTADSKEDQSQLHHFGNPQDLQLPFIAVPISVYGVLCIDRIPSKEKKSTHQQHEPEMGIVDFLSRVGAYLGHAYSNVRKSMESHRKFRRRALISDARQCCMEKIDNSKPSYTKSPSTRRQRTTKENVKLGDQHVFQNDPNLHFKKWTPDIAQELLHLLTSTFLGSNAYWGAVQPGVRSIHFTHCSEKSAMKDRQLKGKTSVSYACFLKQSPTIIDSIEHSQTLQIFNSGSKHDHATTGVYVVVPVGQMGVLVMDGFRGSSSGIYCRDPPSCPENGVVECMVHIASMYSHLVKKHRDDSCVDALVHLVKDTHVTMAMLWDRTFECLANLMLSAFRMSVWYVPTSATFSPERRYVYDPLEGGSEFEMPSSREEFESLCENLRESNIHVCSNANVSSSVMVVSLEDPDVQPGKGAVVLVIERDANWEEDTTLMESILPQLNHNVLLVREKEHAARARSRAEVKMQSLLQSMADAPPQVVMTQMFVYRLRWIQLLSESLGEADVYLGEFEIGKTCLRYFHVSKHSLMANTRLKDPKSLSFQCARDCTPIVVNDLKTNYRDVRFLTSKRPTSGALVLLPLLRVESTFGVLGIDHFHRAAYTLRGHLEPSVFRYVQTQAQSFCVVLQSLHYRVSIDQLLKLRRHPQATVALVIQTLVEVIQHTLLSVRFQHVLELASDFTGNARLLCWDRQRTRGGGGLGNPPQEHHCSDYECPAKLRHQGIHLDDMSFPMSNVPQTLDEARCRSKNQLAFGFELRLKRACCAMMLDQEMARGRLALCIYGSGASSAFTKAEQSFLSKLAHTAKITLGQVMQMQVLQHLVTQGLVLLTQVMLQSESQDNTGSCVLTCGANPKASAMKSRGVIHSSNVQIFPLGIVQSSKEWKPIQSFLATTEEDQGEEVQENTMNPKKVFQISDLTPPQDRALQESFERMQATFETQQKEYRAQYEKVPNTFSKLTSKPKLRRRQVEAAAPAPPPRPPPQVLDVLLKFSAWPQVKRLDLMHFRLSMAYNTPDSDNKNNSTSQTLVQQQCLEMHSRIMSFYAQWQLEYPRQYDVEDGHTFLLSLHETLARTYDSDHRLVIEAEIRTWWTTHSESSKDQTRGRLVQPSVWTSALACAVFLAFGFKHQMVQHQPTFVYQKLCDNAPTSDGRVTRPTLLSQFTTLVPEPVPTYREILRTSSNAPSSSGEPHRKQKVSRVTRAILRASRLTFGSFAGLTCLDEIHKSNEAWTSLAQLFFVKLALAQWQELRSADIRSRVEPTLNACGRIQNLARAFLTRLRFHRYMRLHHAAKCIQRHYRRRLSRHWAELALKHRMAQKIQRCFRLKYGHAQVARQTFGAMSGRTAGPLIGAQSLRVAKAVQESLSSDWFTTPHVRTCATFDAFSNTEFGHHQLEMERSRVGMQMKEETVRRKTMLCLQDRLEELVRDVFNHFTTNRDSTEQDVVITKDQALVMLERLRFPLVPAEMHDILNMVDSDRSGDISLEEFFRWYRYEYPSLVKRSKHTGTMSKAGIKWFIDVSAIKVVEKKWRLYLEARDLEVVKKMFGQKTESKEAPSKQ